MIGSNLFDSMIVDEEGFLKKVCLFLKKRILCLFLVT